MNYDNLSQDHMFLLLLGHEKQDFILLFIFYKFVKEIFRCPLEWNACIYGFKLKRYNNQTDKVCVFNKLINTIISNHVKTIKYIQKI